ncbi:MAG TPA: C69 family dipeptidase [Candidatus Coprenecus pullistercoris]|nr:C69 family dipeptidase [Candidatus Coprenecus pullistercoris]
MNKILKTALCAAAACLIAQTGYACTNVLVTKGASKDGSVFVTYAADSHQLYGELYFSPAGFFKPGTMLNITEWDTGRFLGQIPQVARTYQTVGNMNEHQLIITETTYGGRGELYDSTGIMDYGSLIYITLQRARTAREAIQTIVDLANEYGYASSGESFSIADKDEVWIMEFIGKGTKLDKKGRNVNKGIVWVAARVPDGYICAHANQARIRQIDFNDPENWLYSEDVVDFAREMGYYEGSDEDFSFCDAYAPLNFSGLRGCESRVWSAFNILCDGVIDGRPAEEYLDYAMGYNADNRLPLFVKPAEKVSFKEVADVMRDHFEGSPMDMTVDAGAGGHHTPYRWRPMDFEYDGKTYVNERAIATQQTGFWIVCQSRSWLPDEIGGVLWFGVDDAATSCLTPVYTNVSEIPQCIKVGNGSLIEYSPTSLFWVTNRIANFAYMLYDRIEPEVRAVIDEREEWAQRWLSSADNAALQALGEEPTEESIREARDYMTRFSMSAAQSLFDTWKELDIYLLVKYMDGNVKKMNGHGTFLNNGYSDRIPAAPDQPGYSDKWKEVVAKDAGEILEVR